MGTQWSPEHQYDEEEIFRISGKMLNEIGDDVLALQRKVKLLKRKLAEKETDGMKQELKELRLRDKNVALRDVWDQYQTVLTLVESKNSD